MTSHNGQGNGILPFSQGSLAEEEKLTPDVVKPWVEAGVRFVYQATGFTLDGSPETLPVLDHYVRHVVASVDPKAPARSLAVAAVTAYLGEVICRAHDAWWHVPGEDPSGWELRFASPYLVVSPYAFARAALEPDAADDEGGIRLDGADEENVALHLAHLPPLDEEEYRLPSTRFEVIQIIVDFLRARAEAQGLGDVVLNDQDYDLWVRCRALLGADLGAICYGFVL